MSTDTERSPLISDDDLRVAVTTLREIAESEAVESVTRADSAKALLSFGATCDANGFPFFR